MTSFPDPPSASSKQSGDLAESAMISRRVHARRLLRTLRPLPLAVPGSLAVTAALATFLACAPADEAAAGGGETASATPPASETSTPSDVALADEPISVAGLNLYVPESWQATEPASRMRAAQFVLPGSGGDGELTVFFFGAGSGGGVQANLERWAGQMVSEEPATTGVVNGQTSRATWIDSSGTLKASQMGTFPSTDQPNYRLLGAVIEGAGGPWFLKAIGPEATMAENRDAFMAAIEKAAPGA